MVKRSPSNAPQTPLPKDAELLRRIDEAFNGLGYSPKGRVEDIFLKSHANVAGATRFLTYALLPPQAVRYDHIIIGRSQQPIAPDIGSEQRWVSHVNTLSDRIIHEGLAGPIMEAIKNDIGFMSEEVRNEIGVILQRYLNSRPGKPVEDDVALFSQQMIGFHTSVPNAPGSSHPGRHPNGSSSPVKP